MADSSDIATTVIRTCHRSFRITNLEGTEVELDNLFGAPSQQVTIGELKERLVCIDGSQREASAARLFRTSCSSSSTSEQLPVPPSSSLELFWIRDEDDGEDESDEEDGELPLPDTCSIELEGGGNDEEHGSCPGNPLTFRAVVRWFAEIYDSNQVPKPLHEIDDLGLAAVQAFLYQERKSRSNFPRGVEVLAMKHFPKAILDAGWFASLDEFVFDCLISIVRDPWRPTYTETEEDLRDFARYAIPDYLEKCMRDLLHGFANEYVHSTTAMTIRDSNTGKHKRIDWHSFPGAYFHRGCGHITSNWICPFDFDGSSEQREELDFIDANSGAISECGIPHDPRRSVRCPYCRRDMPRADVFVVDQRVLRVISLIRATEFTMSKDEPGVWNTVRKYHADPTNTIKAGGFPLVEDMTQGLRGFLEMVERVEKFHPQSADLSAAHIEARAQLELPDKSVASARQMQQFARTDYCEKHKLRFREFWRLKTEPQFRPAFDWEINVNPELLRSLGVPVLIPQQFREEAREDYLRRVSDLRLTVNLNELDSESPATQLYHGPRFFRRYPKTTQDELERERQDTASSTSWWGKFCCSKRRARKDNKVNGGSLTCYS